MKNFTTSLIFLSVVLFAASRGEAAISVLDYYRLGENDSGAANAQAVTASQDSAGSKALSAIGAPQYSTNVSTAAAARLNSLFRVSFGGTSDGLRNNAVLTGTNNNFGLEMWVKPATNSGGRCIAYNGDTGGSGWGIYQFDNTFQGFFGGLDIFGSGSLSVGAWTHLAMVRDNGVTTLYVNGVASGTSGTTPNPPAGKFSVGVAPTASQEYFSGLIDEVRVFTFAQGQFSTNDLLLSAPLLSAPDLAGLSISTGTLAPAFSTNVTNYSVLVPVGTASLSVTPTASAAYDTITVNGASVASGSASAAIPINPGSNNVISIVVSLPGGTPFKTFSLTVLPTNIVTTTADSDVGSLRQAIADAAAHPGPATIIFAPALSGQTITLSSGPLAVEGTNAVTIDASALPDSLAINAGGSDRGVINTSPALTLRALTITAAYTPPGYGGGAILNDGVMTIERCTLAANNADYASAVWTEVGATTTLRNCTLANNYSPTQGGAIENKGTTSLIHCTVSGNISGNGGGIYNADGASLTIENSIVGNNSYPDIINEGTMDGSGSNIVSTAIFGSGNDNAESTINFSAPLLAALGNYGGGLATMPPQNISPAIDSAVGSTELIDERGYPRPVDGNGDKVAIADIGAAELSPSDGIFLANLMLSAVALMPSFDNVTNYSASVPYEISNTFVTPVAFSASTVITVNGAVVASGGTSTNIPFAVGMNTITVEVSQPGGLQTNTYTANIFRADNPKLSSLAVSVGALAPSFDPATTSYLVNLPNSTTNIAMTPTAELPNATIKINGTAVASGAASSNFALSMGLNTFNIVVTAPDGVTTETYVVQVYRAIVVSSLADHGPGSLRDSVTAASACPFAVTITFDPSLDGQTIGLTGGAIPAHDTYGLTIDASALAHGITINANGNSQIIYEYNIGALTLKSLTLTGGNAPGGTGGAIRNEGDLSLDRCTLFGNTAGYGGAIYSFGTLYLSRCTVASNSAAYLGGAFFIYNNLHLTHCTVAGNAAANYGGVYMGGGGLYLENTIVAGNSGANAPDVGVAGSSFFVENASNIVQTPFYVASPNTLQIESPNTVTNTAPLLAPLGNYGGPALTMPPMSGSPAIDAAIPSSDFFDQRGVACPQDGNGDGVAVADIGAVEVIGKPQISSQPVSITGPAGVNTQFSVSAYSDITPLYYQWFLNGNPIPGANASSLSITNCARGNAGLYSVVITNTVGSVTSTNALLHLLISQKIQSLTQTADHRWTFGFDDADGSLLTTNNLADFEIQSSTNLVNWSTDAGGFTAQNGKIQFTETTNSTGSKCFFRVRSK